jgi:hypothetical protein
VTSRADNAWIYKVNVRFRGAKIGFCDLAQGPAGWDVTKIELPESWAGVAAPEGVRHARLLFGLDAVIARPAGGR